MKIEKVDMVPCDDCGELLKENKYKITVGETEFYLCETCLQEMYEKIFEMFMEMEVENESN